MTSEPEPRLTAQDIVAIEDMIAAQVGTSRDVVLLQGEATLPLEAAALAVARPGGRALNIVTGPYGELFGQWLATGGVQVESLRCGDDEVVTAAAVARALEARSVDVVAVVHAEAATGGRNPLDAIAAVVAAAGAMLLVDAVASVGADPIDPDGWNADIVVIGAQKALAGPAGVSAAIVSDRAWAFAEDNPAAPRSSYLSLLDFKHGWLDGGRRVLPGYVANWETAALRRALDAVAGEGLAGVIGRHRDAAAAARRGLREIGLAPWIAADEEAGCVVTTFAAPADRSPARVVELAHAHGGRMTTPAPGPLADRVLRINHTGRSADVAAVEAELAALGAALSSSD